jgi:type I restriction enzyme S subunit
MANEWEETTVADLVKRQILERPMDGNHGSIHPKGQDFVTEGVPFIMASDLVGGGIDTLNCSFITLEQAKSLRKGFAKNGDVLISHKATLGRTAIIRDIPGDFVMLTPQVTYYRPKDPKRLNNRYLKYYFDSEQFQQVLQSWAGAGSTRAYIGITDQLRLPIVLPPIDSQNAIVKILGVLDDKIELNRRMNETLEGLARAIFQSWFVDFDPVRAKRDGMAPPGLTPEIAVLFPDSFVHEANGEFTPVGWKRTNLGQVIEIYDSKRIPLSSREREQRNGPYPYYGAASAMDFVDGYLFDGIYVLMGEDGSVINEDGTPVLQYVWGKFWVNNHAHVLVGTSGVSQEHLLIHLQRSNVTPFVTGAVQPKLNQANMKRIDFLLPTSEVCTAFAGLVGPLYAKLRANTEQSRQLAAIRDAFLPKLLSGEIRVAGAERLVEDAG